MGLALLEPPQSQVRIAVREDYEVIFITSLTIVDLEYDVLSNY